MPDCMTFPENWHDFLNDYSFDDSKEIYTNGTRLIPVFRVEQLIEHLLKSQEPKYPIRKQSKHGWFFYCPKCEIILNDMARPKYCSECGQAVRWIG